MPPVRMAAAIRTASALGGPTPVGTSSGAAGRGRRLRACGDCREDQCRRIHRDFGIECEGSWRDLQQILQRGRRVETDLHPLLSIHYWIVGHINGPPSLYGGCGIIDGDEEH